MCTFFGISMAPRQSSLTINKWVHFPAGLVLLAIVGKWAGAPGWWLSSSQGLFRPGQGEPFQWRILTNTSVGALSCWHWNPLQLFRWERNLVKGIGSSQTLQKEHKSGILGSRQLTITLWVPSHGKLTIPLKAEKQGLGGEKSEKFRI